MFKSAVNKLEAKHNAHENALCTNVHILEKSANWNKKLLSNYYKNNHATVTISPERYLLNEAKWQ